MELVITIIGTIAGVAGLAYGIYQNRTKTQLEELTRQNSWSTYRTCYQTFQKIWHLHESTEGDLPPDLAKAETSIRELHGKCIEQIIRQFPDLTESNLVAWKESGKLVDQFSLDEFRKQLNNL